MERSVGCSVFRVVSRRACGLLGSRWVGEEIFTGFREECLGDSAEAPNGKEAEDELE